MKTILKLLVLSACLMCASVFASCSKMGGFGGSSGYIEVTVDGKTFKEKIGWGAWGNLEGVMLYTQYNGEQVSLEMAYTKYLEDLVEMPTGTYRLFGIRSEDYGENNFDLCLGIHDKHRDNYRGVENNTGVNRVTSIKKSGECVVVKGEFSGKLEGGSDISGKYKLTLESY